MRFVKRGLDKILQQQDCEGSWYDIDGQEDDFKPARAPAHMLSDDRILELVTQANLYLIDKQVIERVKFETYKSTSGMFYGILELERGENRGPIVVKHLRTMLTPRLVNRILNEFVRTMQDRYGWEERDIFVKSKAIPQ